MPGETTFNRCRERAVRSMTMSSITSPASLTRNLGTIEMARNLVYINTTIDRSQPIFWDPTPFKSPLDVVGDGNDKVDPIQLILLNLGWLNLLPHMRHDVNGQTATGA